MFDTRKDQTGEWVLLLARLPGHSTQPGGILLVDNTTNRLHLRLRDDLGSEDEDWEEVWRELAADLRQMAQEMGGTGVLAWFEEHASHTFTIGPRRQLLMKSAETALDRLFQTHVAGQTAKKAKVIAFSRATPLFSEELLAVRQRLPRSPQNALQTIATLRNPYVSFRRVEKLIDQDPTLAAHLLKLANSPLFYAGGEIRTVTRAILHVGLERAVRHLSALVLKPFFSSSELQKVWNHSLLAAQTNYQLATFCRYPEPDEVLLLGLLHDIGQIVLHSLGENFHRAYRQLRQQGHYPVEIERQLLGKSHAEVGADLLASWSFPDDVTEAIRYHHEPSRSQTLFTSFLYVTESWLESNEDVFNPAEHQSALQRLQINRQDLARLSRKLDPELTLLRFAA